MYLKPIESRRLCVLVIESDASAMAALTRIVSARGFEVHGANSGRSARDVLACHPVDLAVAELFEHARDRQELVAAIREHLTREHPTGDATDTPTLPVIAMSRHSMWRDLAIFSAADDLGAAAVLQKPFTAASLLHLLDQLLPSIDTGVQSRRPALPYGTCGTRIGANHHPLDGSSLVTWSDGHRRPALD